ncbi:trypsin-like serine protease [Mangrovimicrobium sediminis]|uniref:Trypsin-like serine protease n=1 Tax=Mangrovimicrobium sediminis TaxID=2562682 RepID=A0A4Z0M3G8_9GAMM|nr:trypsin-like peptidase domain-containing protein [Haliea sp. SAOS-164]TGD74004.1 trypsin-like serine protease [Haliea sp. SAOS-164]
MRKARPAALLALFQLLLLALLLAAPARAEVDYLSFATEDEANSTEIFSRASPSVVYVTNTALRRIPFTLNIQEIPRGAGTGFVWDASGLIVTNFHVIAGADKLIVTLGNRQDYDAQVVGVAPEKDLAVLRIENPPDDLASLPLGDSSELSVGRKVLAIGNPFGLDTTLTTGVVSALGREIQAPGGRTIRGVIQTDAAINPGNSGGPLLNSLGQLVGVNTAIYSPSGASAGIGFAIPVNTVRDVVPQLIAYGRVLHPIIGVELASDNWIRRNRIDGVPVVHVYPGLPAARAGIQGAQRISARHIELGDVITHVADERVRSNDDYLSALEQYKPGDRVRIRTRRGEQEMRFEVELTESQ